MENMMEHFTALALTYGPRLIGAILVLLVGLKIISVLSRWITKGMKNIEPSLKSFMKSMTSIVLKILLVISVMGMVGIEMTSFVAIVAAAGLAVGLALSGTLQNFAGGVIILIFKPFKVGHYITAQGHSGTVDEIQIFNTILRTPDNKMIVIPNGGLSTGSLINFSEHPTRRVDWTFGIAYGDSYQKARKVLLDLINQDQRIMNDPAPFIALSELADSSVNLALRAWVNAPDYWDVYFDMNQKVYTAFAAEGLNIPFPQMDIHLQNALPLAGPQKMWTPPEETPKPGL